MTATISPCSRYRYTLERDLGMLGEGTCLFVMLNPSTAAGDVNDPTVTRCIKFAQTWGYRELQICNLFALRSTDPALLALDRDPVGPDNDVWLAERATKADFVVVAWGAHPEAATRAEHVLGLIRAVGKTPHCLGLTDAGDPKHPLARGEHRIPDNIAPIPFEAIS